MSFVTIREFRYVSIEDAVVGKRVGNGFVSKTYTDAESETAWERIRRLENPKWLEKYGRTEERPVLALVSIGGREYEELCMLETNRS